MIAQWSCNEKCNRCSNSMVRSGNVNSDATLSQSHVRSKLYNCMKYEVPYQRALKGTLCTSSKMYQSWRIFVFLFNKDPSDVPHVDGTVRYVRVWHTLGFLFAISQRRVSILFVTGKRSDQCNDGAPFLWHNADISPDYYDDSALSIMSKGFRPNSRRRPATNTA